MAKVVLAWELGANLGHIAPLRMIARHLRAQGHDCCFAARDLAGAEEFLEPELGPVLQAPVRLGPGRNLVRTQVSYASLLNNTGFDDILGLAGRLRAWRGLLQDRRAALLVADHAPTALLAARTLGLPAVHIGTGFTVPPLQQPFPVFRPDSVIAAEVLRHNETAVLANINAALARLQLPALHSLQDLFTDAAQHVLSYAELDHYPGPRPEPHAGVPDSSHGSIPEWPPGDGPKILGYLRPYKDLSVVLEALKQSRARVLLRVGDTSAARLRAFERPGLRIIDQPLNMRLAARDCDAFINYASHGVTAEMLLAGKPGLLLPTNLERELVARRAIQLGACLTPPAQGDFNLSEALRRLIEDHGLRNAAQSWAARYAAQDRAQDRAQILPRITDEALQRFSIR